MYQIIEQSKNRIEIALSNNLTKEEFIQIIHNLESLIRTFGTINILFDATHLKVYEFKILLDEFEFYKSFKGRINRIALISQSDFQNFFLSLFNKFTEIEIKAFIPTEGNKARAWVFPSKWP
jgi:SpoIIAA-like